MQESTSEHDKPQGPAPHSSCAACGLIYHADELDGDGVCNRCQSAPGAATEASER